VIRSRERDRFDAVIVGGGHNGLVAAALLGQAGRRVLVLERREELGGAAVSGTPFAGVGVHLSRFAYLVSLFPEALLGTLGVGGRLRGRAFESYAPQGESGLLVAGDGRPTPESLARTTDDPDALDAWKRFHAMVRRVAERVFPTLSEPLRSRAQLRELVADDEAWSALIEQPLSRVLERTFSSDLVRGVVATDALIGTFAQADDPSLRQNRCFLYHVIGNGTGRWDVPVGGMGALASALADAARRAGAELRTGAEVVSVNTDGATGEVQCADGSRYAARDVLSGVAPAVLSELLGEDPPADPPEGSQLKLNMLVRRLPSLRDRHVTAEQAFTGTFHVNEGYGQLQRAFEEASAGRIPVLPPCDLYCHSLTDPSILSEELRAAGAHTMTAFALHMPARLFAGGDDAVKRDAVRAVLRSIDSVLAEPLEGCLWEAQDGSPCLEALTPTELQAELGMPGGHIFHQDLAWPFAEAAEDVGTWGVETASPNIWLCGAGARRGGGVSGIPGHNAARAVLEARRS
jgi:phytoene dehydrogenase-like protein